MCGMILATAAVLTEICCGRDEQLARTACCRTPRNAANHESCLQPTR